MISTGLKFVSALLLSFSICACGNIESKNTTVKTDFVQRDTSITKETAFSELFLDSLLLEEFVTKHKVGENRQEQLRNFYKSRNYQFAWFTEEGLAQQGRSFWNLHNNYVNYSQDSSFFDQQLHQKMEALINEEEDNLLLGTKIIELELQLTQHFFDYAQYAFAGKVDPSDLKWYIPRKKINAVALLDSLVNSNGQAPESWEPLNQQYKLVRNELLRLYKLQQKGGWPAIEANKKLYEQGDSAAAIQQIKQRLLMGGDYKEQDTSRVFTEELRMAVLKAQQRFGLNQDGAIGPATLRALQVPVEKRIEQLLVNMERMRWMPPQSEGERLVANIPEYKLHVYEGDSEVFNMKIVVGKAANKTVIFNDQLKHIVFSPYWNIPRSIVRNEILPAMERSATYLSRNNMEQTGTSGGLPIIRQKPGPWNALGRVKFLFPNSYNIYFHDTPSKSLFNERRRAFSHGCIRVEEPQKLAHYLLQNKKAWTEQAIRKAMFSGTEQWVTLAEPVPVVISYFTAWVDTEGLLNFREDIYGHDKELSEQLFKR